MKTSKPAATNTNKPAHEIRIGGLRATIWANATEKGIRHNVTFERSYKEGEAWKTTQTFGRDDLLALSRMMDKAFDWIAEQAK